MGAYIGLRNYFDRPLQDYAEEFGYHASNILILEGNIARLRAEYPDVYQNMLSCSHHADNRSALTYAQDLVASWIFEDYFIRTMQNDFFDIRLSGTDRTRRLLSRKQTSTNSDYLITAPNGFHITMELVNDYTGFWYRNHVLHLRDNKYLNLQQNQSLLLAIALSPSVQKYAMFDFRETIPARWIPSHPPFGGKSAYELAINRESLTTFSPENVMETISNLLER